MKCKLTRDLKGSNPKYRPEVAERARQLGKRYTVPREINRPNGSIIDHPDAYMLVQNGCAIPDDEECRIAANMTPAQCAAAHQAYDDLESGKDIEEYLEELEEEEATEEQ